MRRLISAAIVLLVMLAGTALAEGPTLSIDAPREEIRPGRPAVITFTVPEDGTCSIGLLDETGTAALTVTENRPVKAGYNSMYWNGTCEGIPVAEGNWTMTIRMNGMSAETAVTVGRMIPCLISARIRWRKAVRF